MLYEFYNALWFLGLPFVKRYLRKRALKSPAYLDHWNERFGLPAVDPVKKVIWVHAVSVGETRAAQPIIEKLLEKFPEASLLVTQMTPTGRKTAEQLYPQAHIRYLPYDRTAYTAQFFADYQPMVGVLMETEIWPNLIFSAQQAKVPLFLVNGRLSEKSLKGYLKVASLIKPAVAALTGIAAQTQADADRLCQIGAREITVCGNSKYDVKPSASQLETGAMFQKRLHARQAWICASTREGEEALILKAWKPFSDNHALLVIVPRHPERFNQVKVLAETFGFNVQCRSDNQDVAPDTQVWIGDSMGELYAYYSVVQLAFIGGSLLPFGGQNLIEAASMNLPVIFGPHMFNFQQASEQAMAVNAAIEIDTAEQLVQTVTQLLTNHSHYNAMKQGTFTFTEIFQGASEKIVNYVVQHLDI